MTRWHRALVLVTLLGVIGAPLLTLHPVTVHLFDAGQQRIPGELEDAAVIALFGLIGATLVPLAMLAAKIRCWHLRPVALDRLSSGSTEDSRSGIAFRVVPIEGVVFVTAGVWRPTIYVSSGALETLPEPVIVAALLHERAHQRRQDVAWRFALAILETAFRPLSRTRQAIDGLRLECEIAADREALAAGAGRANLFDALVAASGSALPAGTVGLASGATMERLALLAEPTQRPAAAATRPFLGVVAALSLAPLLAHTLFWVGLVCL